LVERAECLVDHKKFFADFFGILRDAFARHHPGCRSERQSRSHMIVSIVTRTVYGEEQFSRLNRAGINRDAGQPGQGVEARGRRDTQSFSHLTNCPPHCVSNGLGFTRKPALSKVLDFAAEIRRKT
jgi:hypothetical protein